jgi:hypothetical protein
MLASIPLKDAGDPLAKTFQNAVRNHDWNRVLAFQEWDGGYDNYELYGIRSTDHPLVLVIVWDPLELFYNEKIVDTEILNETDSRELLSLTVNKEWEFVRR